MFAVTLVTAAAFGPYVPVITGFRTEQIVDYSLGVTVIVLGAGWVRRVSTGAIVVVGTYLLVLFVALLGVVNPPSLAGIEFLRGNSFAGIDNLALPVTVVAISQAVQNSHADRDALVRRVCQVVVLAMSVNTLLAFASQKGSLTGFLSHFWDSGVNDPSTDSVAGRAAQLGRLTGAFNQPTEAGVMYGVALLAAIYLYRERSGKLAVTGVLLTAGGLLTVSKLFVLVAVPIGAWQILRSYGGTGVRRGRRTFAFATVLLVAAGAGQTGLIPAWTGSQYLSRLVKPSGGLVDFYSANRFGGGTSSVSPLIHTVLHTSPLVGFGAGGLQVPYDDSWVEGLVYAGLFGLIGYTLVMLAVWRGLINRRHLLARGESGLVGGILLIVIAGSIGLPVLTGNRIATVLWLLFGLTAFAPKPATQELEVEREHDGVERSLLTC